jgi:hypothetical protein
MTRPPVPSHCPESAYTQIDTAVLRLVDLLARQIVRELAADAPDPKETSDAAKAPQEE